MPHLDAARRRVWEATWATWSRVDRNIDAALRAEWAIPLGWFEVLNSLREAGGTARPLDLAELMEIPASTLSRRLDRLEEEGWIERQLDAVGSDLRAVEVELTASGRRLWREMNISYRRLLQREFASHLSDEEIAQLDAITRRLGHTPNEP